MASSDLALFLQIPWSAKLLADPDFELIPTDSRTPKPTTEDSFIAETLQSQRTVRAWITQHRVPGDYPSCPIREARSFLQLGDGVCGFPGVCHGGMIATLLDEVTGVLLTANAKEVDNRAGTSVGLTAFTAYLNVSYKKPLPAPGFALAVAKIKKIEGRKIYISSSLEDGLGAVFATAEIMFIETLAKL
ncbi:HotDog domain-containing protein [Phyllosticta citribraziliensis]|uniref:HotDog domain-containing protein n=1 Tax=Phyllosticta citribraziliensis TaxID=989973 RepID=A0ABR1LKM4_9PEZI